MVWRGGERVSVRVWEIAVVGLLLVVALAGVALLWRSRRRLEQAAKSPPPHPHAKLLKRIDDLRESLAGDSGIEADVSVAQMYTQIVEDAKGTEGVDGSVLQTLPNPSPSPHDSRLCDQTNGTLWAALGQVKSEVE